VTDVPVELMATDDLFGFRHSAINLFPPTEWLNDTFSDSDGRDLIATANACADHMTIMTICVERVANIRSSF
jgi:hypothetical protein